MFLAPSPSLCFFLSFGMEWHCFAHQTLQAIREWLIREMVQLLGGSKHVHREEGYA